MHIAGRAFMLVPKLLILQLDGVPADRVTRTRDTQMIGRAPLRCETSQTN